MTPVDAAETVATASPEELLRADDLQVVFRRGRGSTRAVDGVSFELQRGEVLGLVGESGCGKTTTGRAILRLLPKEMESQGGTVWFDGRDLGSLSKGEMRLVRRRLQMIFQDPLSSFNPRRLVTDIVAEGLEIQGVSKAQIQERVDRALEDVGMSRELVEGRRPHQFSGGQCQRLAIARALALEPDLIVCDEPVASLDVSVQAQVINLLQDIREKRHLALVFISHDLAVVRNISDRLAVMYAGKIVEIGDADPIYTTPAHPYTQTLLDAVPVPDPDAPVHVNAERSEAAGNTRPPSGCRFRTRCPWAQEVCAEVEPELRVTASGQSAACHFPLTGPSEEPAGVG